VYCVCLRPRPRGEDEGGKEMIGVNIIMALVAALVGFWLGVLAGDK
jgi:uncharacterized membrane protein